MKEYQKLVRDKIPDIIQGNGEQPHVCVLDLDKFERALRHKAAEEAHEIIEACSEKEVLLEIADLQEVLDCLKKVHGFSEEEVRAQQLRRREERGGFEKRFFLESVG